jgi:BON domain-containing protein
MARGAARGQAGRCKRYTAISARHPPFSRRMYRCAGQPPSWPRSHIRAMEPRTFTCTLARSASRQRARTSTGRALLIFVFATLSGCAEYSGYRSCAGTPCFSDAEITAQVESQLEERSDFSELDVRTINRVVHLSGRVATEAQKEWAESAACHATDVREVVDLTTVTADSPNRNGGRIYDAFEAEPGCGSRAASQGSR